MKTQPYTTENLLTEGERVSFRGTALGSIVGGTILDTQGDLPQTEAAILAAINALLPNGAPALTAADIYTHTVEAANTSFLPDRFTFMDGTTVANIAANAREGVAFMNAHRIGDYFSAGELPYGRTFAGLYQQSMDAGGGLMERAFVSLYMLRNHEPNGAGGINTDQLERSINGGTVFDVSVTIMPGATGQSICNVCNQDYRNCNHYRGYNENMTLDEQVYARDVLGVPGGVATVRWVNWTCGEISAVYNGAVSGAGF